jgi:hypothetical protein
MPQFLSVVVNVPCAADQCRLRTARATKAKLRKKHPMVTGGPSQLLRRGGRETRPGNVKQPPTRPFDPRSQAGFLQGLRAPAGENR